MKCLYSWVQGRDRTLLEELHFSPIYLEFDHHIVCDHVFHHQLREILIDNGSYHRGETRPQIEVCMFSTLGDLLQEAFHFLVWFYLANCNWYLKIQFWFNGFQSKIRTILFPDDWEFKQSSEAKNKNTFIISVWVFLYFFYNYSGRHFDISFCNNKMSFWVTILFISTL